MLSGSLSVEFFVYINKFLFNVQLRNKYDDGDACYSLLYKTPENDTDIFF